MSEVDYSQFIYKKTDSKKTGDAKTNTTDAYLPRKKNKSGKLFVFVVVLLCFALVFVSIDFFGNGYVKNAIDRVFAGNSYNYHMVVAEHPTRELAYQHSTVIKNGGGSGYVWHDEKFFVVYALYVDKSDATAVANKNTRTYVKTVEYKSKKTDVFNYLDGLLSTLSKASYEYETGSMTESQLLEIMSKLLQEGDSVQQNLQTKDNAESKLLNLTLENLNNINVAKPHKLEIVSDIRYACSSIAINMGNYL